MGFPNRRDGKCFSPLSYIKGKEKNVIISKKIRRSDYFLFPLALLKREKDEEFRICLTADEDESVFLPFSLNDFNSM